MSSPEKGNTPWEEMGISKTKFTILVIREIGLKVANILKTGVQTEIHPKGKKAGVAIMKGATAYGIGQVIGHEFYVIPNIEDIIQAYHGTIEGSVEVYENREQIKDSIVTVLREKEFMDYMKGIGNIISKTLSSAWNLPIKEKFGIYLELAVAGGISGYIKNSRNKYKDGRTMSGILDKFGEKPELKERYYRMKKYKEGNKEEKTD